MYRGFVPRCLCLKQRKRKNGTRLSNPGSAIAETRGKQGSFSLHEKAFLNLKIWPLAAFLGLF